VREITLMHEYRTRLPADVVTRKLEVCPAVTHLPATSIDSTSEPAEKLNETDVSGRVKVYHLGSG
jgi:hypothetical protein